MARTTFGGTLADYVVLPESGVYRRPGSVEVTVWSAQSGGTQLTDLLVGGQPATSLRTGSEGLIPAFQGPDGVTEAWYQVAGASQRVRIATGPKGDTGAPGGSDESFAAFVGDEDSETSSALTTRYATVRDRRAVSVARFLDGSASSPGVTAAAITMASQAAGADGTIFFPRAYGPYRWDTPVSLNSRHIESDGALLDVPAGALPAGAAALTLDGTQHASRISNFELRGPGARSLGTKTAGCDGIKVIGGAKPRFDNLKVQQFDSGFNYANDVGHIHAHQVNATNNYYGVYVSKNTYDYFFNECQINGNTFANFATPADQGIAGLVVTESHVGFAPYGIYQEGTPNPQGANRVFIQDAIFQHARFEAIGNAAIHTDALFQSGTNFSGSADIYMQHPGFSWNTGYRIAGRPRDYAVKLGLVDRVIEIISGQNPFTTGDQNVFYVEQFGSTAALALRGTSSQVATTQVTTGIAPNRAVAYAVPLANGSSPDFNQVTLPASGGLRWVGNSVRMQGDAASLHADFRADNSGQFDWRNADASYALIGRVLKGGIVMPTFFLGAAGAATGPRWTSGTGSPEGVLTAPVGSLYSRTDGGTTSTLYLKESGTGNTGWVAK